MRACSAGKVSWAETRRRSTFLASRRAHDHRRHREVPSGVDLNPRRRFLSMSGQKCSPAHQCAESSRASLESGTALQGRVERGPGQGSSCPPGEDQAGPPPEYGQARRPVMPSTSSACRWATCRPSSTASGRGDLGRGRHGMPNVGPIRTASRSPDAPARSMLRRSRESYAISPGPPLTNVPAPICTRELHRAQCRTWRRGSTRGSRDRYPSTRSHRRVTLRHP